MHEFTPAIVLGLIRCVAGDGMGRSTGISPDHDMAGFDGQAGVRMS